MARLKRLLLILCCWGLINQVERVASAVSSCRAKLTGNSGTFTSPNYPHAPSPPEKSEDQGGFVTCQWEIEIPVGRGIQLKFGDFDMDAPDFPDDCDKGEVEVYSGVGKEKSSLDKFCPGNNADTVTLSSNTATVAFRRPAFFTGAGFLISYIAITPNEPIDDFATCSDVANMWKGESFSVMCPSGCRNILSHTVYGVLEYRDENTRLCRAAIHAGVISDRFGGRVDVRRIPGRSLYLQGTANNVSATSGAMSDYKIIFPKSQECRDSIPLTRSQFSASSYINTTDDLGRFHSWTPGDALLESSLEKAWSPKVTKEPEWIQIDLGRYMTVTGIITRGSQDPYSQTKLYQIKYSDSNIFWHDYQEEGQTKPKTFAGNHNFHSRVTNNFVNPVIRAKYIRVYPILSSEGCELMCGLKISLTGCYAPDPPPPPPIRSSSTTTAHSTTTKKLVDIPYHSTTVSTKPQATSLPGLDTTTSKKIISTDRTTAKSETTNRTGMAVLNPPGKGDDTNDNGNTGPGKDEADNPDMNARTIIIIAIVAGLGVTCLLLAALVLILVRKRKKDPQNTAVPKNNSRDNATYNGQIETNSIYKNNNSSKKKKRGQNSQNGIDFVNRNYRETLSNAGTEDSFQNSRGGVTLRYGQQQENGVALPVRASYSTNSDGMAVSGLVGNILYDENFTANDDDHEYQVIPDSYLGASSTYSSNGSGNRYSGGFAGRQPQWNSNANGWNRRSYGDRPQRMTSFAPDLEDPTSKPIRAGTFPHKKQNNINTEELFSLIPSSGIHHSTSTKPRSSGFKPGQLPPKKSGHDFSQHPFTSNSSSSSQNSGLSDLHPSGNSIPQVPIAEEETQLLQNPERGRKASYNVPNNIPLEPPHLSSFSNTPQAGVFTNGNGIPNDASLRPSNSRAETLNHARLRSGYDQLYRATPTCDPSLPKAKMSTSDYNQLNLHSSAA